ncbi:hypothetical protein OV203_43860 [Nannocystis sp. ILAH1]|uniref:hypothetical protein n=1 Tax=Nannocystis sp. ILAH1 TaxID=2996789 RepID=UPI00226F8230|nr:hypothetical protein [Nannocystis sp. ILAH1]MCY0994146.1 hypothetical protein [Nannocystis sp. ILAH1]
MELRALVTLALSVVLTACSDDGGGGSTGNLTSGTDPSTTTGGTTTGTTTGSEPTTGAPTSEPGTTTTGEPGTTTGDDTTSTTGAPLCDGGGLGPGDHTITLEHGGLMRSADHPRARTSRLRPAGAERSVCGWASDIFAPELRPRRRPSSSDTRSSATSAGPPSWR